MTNFCVKCYTSVFCSACYIFISIWGIIFLGIIAALLQADKAGDIGLHHDQATPMWIATGLYVALLIICAIILKYRLSHPFPNEDEKVDDDDFDTPVGSQPTVVVNETISEQK